MQVFGRALLYFFEHHFDLHLANRLIPCLIPLGLATLLAGAGHPAAALLFVLFYGMGNGMLTIVKGTAIAQYVNREHVATLNGALGLPRAIARALAPLMLGLLWTPAGGYTAGLWILLAASLVAVLALLARAARGASDDSAPGQVAHQRADAEGPARRLVGMHHAVDQRAQFRRRDRHPVADHVREALARPVAVLRRREHGAEEQHEAVGIGVVRADRLARPGRADRG